jgi:hypothetical protein
VQIHQPEVLPPYFAARKENPGAHSIDLRFVVNSRSAKWQVASQLEPSWLTAYLDRIQNTSKYMYFIFIRIHVHSNTGRLSWHENRRLDGRCGPPFPKFQPWPCSMRSATVRLPSSAAHAFARCRCRAHRNAAIATAQAPSKLGRCHLRTAFGGVVPLMPRFLTARACWRPVDVEL